MRLYRVLRGCSTPPCCQVASTILSNCLQRPPRRNLHGFARLHRACRFRDLSASATASAAANAGDEQHAPSQAPEGIKEPMTTGNIQSEEERRKKLWFAAVKPPMYTVAVIPILVSIQCSSGSCMWHVCWLPSSAGCCCSCVLHHRHAIH